jgi:hypothetical protein
VEREEGRSLRGGERVKRRRERERVGSKGEGGGGKEVVPVPVRVCFNPPTMSEARTEVSLINRTVRAGKKGGKREKTCQQARHGWKGKEGGKPGKGLLCPHV